MLVRVRINIIDLHCLLQKQGWLVVTQEHPVRHLKILVVGGEEGDGTTFCIDSVAPESCDAKEETCLLR